MSDFIGMGGALVVCVIAQSIVFTALAIMAGVIYLVGITAGDRNNFIQTEPVPALVPSAPAERTEDDDEMAAVMTAAVAAELNGGGTIVIPEQGPVGNWRIVSMREASQRGNLK